MLVLGEYGIAWENLGRQVDNSIKVAFNGRFKMFGGKGLVSYSM
jgi:hypothetical protein